MAIKKTLSVHKRCADCSESYDWHEKGADGKPFLCRCRFRKDGGRYSIFLDDYECDKFKKRNEQQRAIKP